MEQSFSLQLTTFAASFIVSWAASKRAGSPILMASAIVMAVGFSWLGGTLLWAYLFVTEGYTQAIAGSLGDGITFSMFGALIGSVFAKREEAARAVRSIGGQDPKMTSTVIAGTAIVTGLLLSVYWASSPRNYDSCVLKNIKNAATPQAAALVRSSCANLFRASPQTDRFAGIIDPYRQD